MQTVSTLKLIWTTLASFTGMGTVLFFALKLVLENHFQKRLEHAKHELQMEQQRLAVVYENQKDSFRKIIEAMNLVLRHIEDNAEGDGGDWRPLHKREYDDFRRTIAAERLFVDSRAERSLDLFASATWEAVSEDSYSAFTDTETVYRTYRQLQLIANRVAEHFRKCVGLRPESADPLEDIELLDACRLINRYQFPKHGMPTKSELSLSKHDDAEELITVARKNLGILQLELSALRAAIQSTDNAAFYHEPLAKIDRYMPLLKSIKG